MHHDASSIITGKYHAAWFEDEFLKGPFVWAIIRNQFRFKFKDRRSKRMSVYRNPTYYYPTPTLLLGRGVKLPFCQRLGTYTGCPGLGAVAGVGLGRK